MSLVELDVSYYVKSLSFIYINVNLFVVKKSKFIIINTLHYIFFTIFFYWLEPERENLNKQKKNPCEEKYFCAKNQQWKNY